MSASGVPAMRVPPGLSWLILGSALLIPAAALLSTTGDPTVYLRYEVPSGQAAYFAAKVFGLYALAALWLQALLGLTGPAASEWLGLREPARLHRFLGALAAALVVAHVVSFVSAASLREGQFAYKLLWPTFHGFYRSVLSLGAIALICIVVAVASVLAWRRAPRARRWLHRLAMVAFALVLVHSYLVGSETRVGMMPLLYGAMICSVMAGVALRAARSARREDAAESA
jgi:DMSO/TMAO reductase YedYZ heme-binding membrane subunit